MFKAKSEPVRFIAIGGSRSGGLRAISAFLAALPLGLNATVLVVLHRASDLPSQLQQVLSQGLGIPVLSARDGEHLCAGCCYIGEPDGHLSMGPGGCVKLVEGTHNKFRNRTVDHLQER